MTPRRLVHWALVALVVAAGVALAVHQQRAWAPALADRGERGDRYTFPGAEPAWADVQNGTWYVWADCGHEACGPFAVTSRPNLRSGHLIVAGALGPRVPLPDPVPKPWCDDTGGASCVAVDAFGPFAPVDYGAEQAAVGLAVAAAATAMASLAWGLQAWRAAVGAGAGVVAASWAQPGSLEMLALVLPGLVAMAFLTGLSRWRPRDAGTGSSRRIPPWVWAAWAAAVAFTVQGALFMRYFPGVAGV